MMNSVLQDLHCYVDGKEEDYEVQDALAILEARFGTRVTTACNDIRKALIIEDKADREYYCAVAMQKIERQIGVTKDRE